MKKIFFLVSFKGFRLFFLRIMRLAISSINFKVPWLLAYRNIVIISIFVLTLINSLNFLNTTGKYPPGCQHTEKLPHNSTVLPLHGHSDWSADILYMMTITSMSHAARAWRDVFEMGKRWRKIGFVNNPIEMKEGGILDMILYWTGGRAAVTLWVWHWQWDQKLNDSAAWSVVFPWTEGYEVSALLCVWDLNLCQCRGDWIIWRCLHTVPLVTTTAARKGSTRLTLGGNGAFTLTYFK